MNRSDKFKAAHAIVKNFLIGDYRACFSMALAHVNKMIKMSSSEITIYVAKFINPVVESAEKIVQKQLSKFKPEVTENKIALLQNTFPIKETLKSLGFKWASVRTAWIKQCDSSEEMISIANQILEA